MSKSASADWRETSAPLAYLAELGHRCVALFNFPQDQLDAALRLQTVARSYMPIGQVLLANKLISRKRLNALLHRYGKRSRLGEILVKVGRITHAQLEEAATDLTLRHGAGFAVSVVGIMLAEQTLMNAGVLIVAAKSSGAALTSGLTGFDQFQHRAGG